MENALVQLNNTLGTLKDFQRATVDRTVENFSSADHSQRVLIADEVGLGKTIVAKGVIARLLMNWIGLNGRGKVTRPMRVTYVCSNLTLAAENRRKLAVFDQVARERYVQEPSFGRLLELSVKPDPAASTKLLEVCSLTPSTSFTLTQGDGNMRERYILFQCLVSDPRLEPYGHNLNRLFQNGVLDSSWKHQAHWFDNAGQLDPAIVDDFLGRLAEKAKVAEEALEWLGLDSGSGHLTWMDLFKAVGNHPADGESTKEQTKWLYGLRVHVRSELARSCARNLRADLFILDEFQRFKALLNTDVENEEALIAHEVFNRQDGAKILLLSATPFKAMSRIDDDEGQEAHHEELRHLLTFLMNGDETQLSEYEQARKTLLGSILGLRDPQLDVASLEGTAKARVEKALTPFICRTERSQVSENFDTVYRQRALECFETFTGANIISYQAMTKLAQALDRVRKGRQGARLLEFYKSAPWPLSFLSGYRFKERLDKVLDHTEIKSALKRSSAAWLPRSKIDSYRLDIGKDAPNAKVQPLLDLVFSERSEELLWLPPSSPHYQLEGCFNGNEDFTKTLLFSSWAMVPRALSGLLSYEAERRLLGRRRKKTRYYKGKNKKTPPLIRFEGKAGLTGWSLVYPSKTLIDRGLSYGLDSFKSLVAQRQSYFSLELKKLKKFAVGESSRNLWYAIASMLLDRENDHKDWFNCWLKGEFDHAAESKDKRGRISHLNRISKLLSDSPDSPLRLGQMPDDLAEYLARLSMAAPGICAARMFGSIWKTKENAGLSAESRVGMVTVQMFNKPESVNVILKGYKGKEYWRKILEYCAAGDLQAVFDEYGHLLKDAGLTVKQAAARLSEVMGFKTSTVACQFGEAKYQPVSRESRAGSTLRCHYAVSLGNQKTTEEGQQRVGHIRDAFNSPFKPFVLNSTSIGQEGLDFHWYCSRVVHWNLPSNPIDIEQREGRINRYKSLVVRRRVAETLAGVNQTDSPEEADHWGGLFGRVDRLTVDRQSDLVPFWHMPTGSAQIERVVLMMPLSREVGRLNEILKVLSLYRLAFGQPRQEELILNLLHRNFNDDDIKKITKFLVINLAPLKKVTEDERVYEIS